MPAQYQIWTYILNKPKNLELGVPASKQPK